MLKERFALTVIGKGGVKINEIRTQSQCVIRVTDPGTPALPGGAANMHERLITIQGNPININIAVGLLHSVSLDWDHQVCVAL